MSSSRSGDVFAGKDASVETLIGLAVLRVYGRHVTEAERKIHCFHRFLARSARIFRGETDAVLERLCLALMNTNEFLFVD